MCSQEGTNDRRQSSLINYRVIYSITVKSKTLNFFPMVLDWVYVGTCLSERVHCVNSCLDFASVLHPGCYLFGLEPRWDPCVLLGGAARVIVGDGVSLKVRYQLRHHLFQLARNWTHCMLLSNTLAMHTDLPVETGTASGLIPGDFFFFWFTTWAKGILYQIYYK